MIINIIIPPFSGEDPVCEMEMFGFEGKADNLTYIEDCEHPKVKWLHILTAERYDTSQSHTARGKRKTLTITLFCEHQGQQS